MKMVRWPLVSQLGSFMVVLIVAVSPSQAWGEVLAADDFENITAEFTPTDVTNSVPSAGSWLIGYPDGSTGGLSSNALIRGNDDGVGPPAYSGNNKLNVNRQLPYALVGFGDFSTEGPFPQAIAGPGDLIQISFQLNVQNLTGALAQMGFMTNPGTEGVETPALANILEINNAGFGTNTPFGITYYTEANGRGPVPGGISATPDVWEKWVIDYTVGSTSLNVSIDGPTQGLRTTTIPNFGRGTSPSLPNVVGWDFQSGNPGTNYYLDDILVTIERATVSLPGDVNGDGIVNGQDIAVVATNWLQTAPPSPVPGDANNDGIVNGQDIAIIATHWLETSNPGGAAAVPEPNSMMLAVLGLAGLAACATRKSFPKV